jgi:hypothetical protein
MKLALTLSRIINGIRAGGMRVPLSNTGALLTKAVLLKSSTNVTLIDRLLARARARAVSRLNSLPLRTDTDVVNSCRFCRCA